MVQTYPCEKTHGMSKTRLYNTWKNMKGRCYRESSTHWVHYGGRGISVCESWHNFEPFRDWAFSAGYTEHLTLDRIDVNGNYEPGNCRWIESSENTSRMMAYNLERELGLFTNAVKEKSKRSLIELYGKPVLAINEEERIFSESVGELARTLSNKLGRNFVSVKQQLKLCLKGKCNSCGGYKIYDAKIDIT